MYDQIASGRQVRLSIKQRQWADSIYDENDLDKERPPARKIEIRDKSLLSPLDAMPMPLKPPGRS